MSNAQLTISGGANATTGIVTVPSAFSGAMSAGGGINAMLQDYLNGFASLVASGSWNLDNNDLANGTDYPFTVTGATGSLQEYTDTDSTGSASGTSINASGAYLSPLGTALVVEAPGNETITGVGPATNFVLFGANSNVDYTVTNPAQGSIFAAGGTDSITLLDDGVQMLNDTINGAGNDTLNLFGQGSVNANSDNGASDAYVIDDTNATVTATGNATVGVNWRDVNSGGTLYFVNNSTNPATVFSSVFGDAGNSAHVTAFGGAGGGYFDGGQGNGALPNFLVGGAVGSVSVNSSGAITQVSADSAAGAVTLVGAVNGDVLDAQSGLAQNDLFAGSGSETLIAASTTGANLFALGYGYPGLGSPQSNGVVSTEGSSGNQTFFLGNSAAATLYGSDAMTGSNGYNIYNILSDATAGGGNFTIENFASTNSVIYLVDAADTGPGSASVSASNIITDPFNHNNTLIGLSDGTQITLVEVQASSLGISTSSNGLQAIIKT